MSAYRVPEPQPLLANRFERVLPGLFTRVRISEKRVRVDAPDVMALITFGAALQLLVPVIVLQLLVPVIAHWSWLWAFAFSAAVLFTIRIHLKVTKGKVWLVRTVLGVPWSVRRPMPSAECVQIDSDDEGDDLVVLVAPDRKDEGRTVCVLSSPWHIVSWLELEEIRKACSRLLAGDDLSTDQESE
jgi:hypothetical protein